VCSTVFQPMFLVRCTTLQPTGCCTAVSSGSIMGTACVSTLIDSAVVLWCCQASHWTGLRSWLRLASCGVPALRCARRHESGHGAAPVAMSVSPQHQLPARPICAPCPTHAFLVCTSNNSHVTVCLGHGHQGSPLIVPVLVLVLLSADDCPHHLLDAVPAGHPP
jgi:hypothetical protein